MHHNELSPYPFTPIPEILSSPEQKVILDYSLRPYSYYSLKRPVNDLPPLLNNQLSGIPPSIIYWIFIYISLSLFKTKEHRPSTFIFYFTLFSYPVFLFLKTQIILKSRWVVITLNYLIIITCSFIKNQFGIKWISKMFIRTRLPQILEINWNPK